MVCGEMFQYVPPFFSAFVSLGGIGRSKFAVDIENRIRAAENCKVFHRAVHERNLKTIPKVAAEILLKGHCELFVISGDRRSRYPADQRFRTLIRSFAFYFCDDFDDDKDFVSVTCLDGLNFETNIHPVREQITESSARKSRHFKAVYSSLILISAPMMAWNLVTR